MVHVQHKRKTKIKPTEIFQRCVLLFISEDTKTWGATLLRTWVRCKNGRSKNGTQRRERPTLLRVTPQQQPSSHEFLGSSLTFSLPCHTQLTASDYPQSVGSTPQSADEWIQLLALEFQYTTHVNKIRTLPSVNISICALQTPSLLRKEWSSGKHSSRGMFFSDPRCRGLLQRWRHFCVLGWYHCQLEIMGRWSRLLICWILIWRTVLVMPRRASNVVCTTYDEVLTVGFKYSMRQSLAPQHFIADCAWWTASADEVVCHAHTYTHARTHAVPLCCDVWQCKRQMVYISWLLLLVWNDYFVWMNMRLLLNKKKF